MTDKQDAEKQDQKKNEEESIFEKTRYGWLLRDLQIETDEEVKTQ